MNLHSIIRCEYGSGGLNFVRDYENCAKKVARFRNHLRFNLHCKHHGVTPVSLRLHSTVQGKSADNILRRAERSLLGVRIGQTVRKLGNFNKDFDNFAIKIDERLPSKREEVMSFVASAQMREHDLTKTRQQNKFKRLIDSRDKIKQSKNKVNNSLANECMSKWVKNCSDRILSDPELSVLKKGLNFAVTPRRVPVIDIVTVTESACRQLNNSDSNSLRAKVLNLLEHSNKVKDQNVSVE